MLDIKRKIKAKKIQSLYNINEITEQGNIVINNKIIAIYKIHPINILNADDEYKNKIYSTYMAWIKNIDNIQIIINTKEKTFSNQIKEYEKRLKKVSSIELKNAINKYIKYLEQQGIEKENYIKEMYVIVNDDKYNNKQDIDMFITGLTNIGVEVEKVIQKEKINKILKTFIIKDRNGTI